MGSLNGLLQFLVENIALAGEQGLEVGEILESVEHFYGIRSQQTKRLITNPKSQVVQTVDRAFLERVWIWLTKNPHVQVGAHREGNNLTLSEIENVNLQRTAANDTGAFLSDKTTNSIHKSGLLRLYTSSEQTWLAVAGHVLDTKKIPPKDFDCLLVIASKREEGILQPDLVKITGQDKRSVPLRTKRLHERGYIHKIPVLASSSSTSLLVLRKFAVQHKAVKEAPGGVTDEETKGDQHHVSHFFGPTKYAQIESQIRHAIDILKLESIMLWDDLKRKAGVFRKSHQSRLLADAFRRLEDIGIIRRVRAKIDNARRSDDLHRSVKILREPENFDWCMLFQSATAQQKEGSMAEQRDNTNRGLSLVGSNQPQTLQFSRSSLPAWTPDQLLVHLIRDVSVRCHTVGASLQTIKAETMGYFFNRPLEQVISRIVSFWQTSQPHHLKHLSLIRDTAQIGKNIYYVYYTYEMFELKVRRGEVAWEAVTRTKQIQTPGEVDSLGFILTDSAAFQGLNKSLTLAECVDAAQDAALKQKDVKKRSLSTRSIMSGHDPQIFGVILTDPLPTRQLQETNLVNEALVEVAHAPGISRGRPRKFSTGSSTNEAAHRSRKHLNAKQESQKKALENQYREANKKFEERVSMGLSESEAKSDMLGEQFSNGSPVNPEWPRERAVRPPKKRKIGQLPGQCLSLGCTDLVDNIAPVARTAGTTCATAVEVGGINVTNAAPESSSSFILTRPKRQLNATARFDALENPERKDASVGPASSGKAFVDRNEQSAHIVRQGFGAYLGASTTFKSTRCRGRPRKSRMIIFKLDSLKTLSWFTDTIEDLEGSASWHANANRPLENSIKNMPMPLPIFTKNQKENAPVSDSRSADAIQIETLNRSEDTPLRIPQIEHSNTTSTDHSIPRLRILPFSNSAKVNAVYKASLTTPVASGSLSEEHVWTTRGGHLSYDGLPATTSEADSIRASNITKSHIIPEREEQANQNKERNTNGGHRNLEDFPRSCIDHSFRTRQGPKFGESAVQDKTSSNISNFSNVAISTISVEWPRLSLPGNKDYASEPSAEYSEAQSTSHDHNTFIPSDDLVVEGNEGNSIELPATPVLEIAPHELPKTDTSSAPNSNSANTKQRVSTKNSHISKGMLKAFSFGSTAVSRKKIIMDIVEASNGIFPGDRELWYPFATAWLRRYPGPKPDQRTVKNAKNSLINEGKLHEKTFTFKDTRGMVLVKSIIILPEISARDAKVTDLEAEIESKYPALFLPQGTDVDRELISAHSERRDSPRATSRVKVYANDLPIALESVTAYFPYVKDRKATATIPKKLHAAGESANETSSVRHLELGQELQELTNRPKTPEEWEKFSGYFVLPSHIDNFPGLLTSLSPSSDLTFPTSSAENIEVERDLSSASNLPRSFSSHQNHVSFSAQETLPPWQASGFEVPSSNQSLAPFIAPDSEILVQSPVDRFLSQSNVLTNLPLPQHQNVTPQSTFNSLVDNTLFWELKNVYPLCTEDRDFFIHYPFPGKHEPVNGHRRKIYLSHRAHSSNNASLASLDGSIREDNHDLVTRSSRKSRSRSKVRKRTENTEDVDIQAPKRRKQKIPKLRVSRLEHIANREEPAPGILLGAKQSSNPAKKSNLRGPRTSTVFESKDDRDLLVAVIIVRVLLGGINQEQNWAIICQMLHQRFDRELLRRRWQVIRSRFRVDMDLGESDFRRTFLQAYEETRIPVLDYGQIWAYDWRWLHSWSIAQLELPARSSIDFPSDRRRFDRMYAIKEYHDADGIDFFEIKNSSTIPQRRAFIHKSPRLMPQADGEIGLTNESQMELAKSWVKANVITPASTYNPKNARSKLLSLGQENVDKAVNQLLSTRIITQENKGRALPGRTYDISQHFLNTFKRNLTVAHFKHAVMFKKRLDAEFKLSNQILFQATAGDGDVIALINLLSQNMIAFYPRNVPKRKFGLTKRGYRTRQMDKAVLDFDVLIKATDGYKEGLPLMPLPLPPLVPQARFNDDATASKIPAWVDINGDCVLLLWHYAVAAVVSSIVISSASNVKKLERLLKSQLERYEIELVLSWLVNAGAANWANESQDAVQLGAWWWTVISE